MRTAKVSKINTIVSGVLDSLKDEDPKSEAREISGKDEVIEVSPSFPQRGELIRIDKNIANNIDVLTDNPEKTEGLSKEDKNLIKNIIYYLCLKRQYDIFGYGMIDPHDFAEMFKYHPATLWKKHENPIQLRGLSNEEKERLYQLEQDDMKHHIYDSIFENAMYWLHTNVLRFKRAAKDVVINNETVSFIESKSYVLLPEIKLTIRKEKKNNKYLYSYVADKNFITNLSLYYLNCNKQSLILLRQSSLDDLYLFLSNARAAIVEELRNTKANSYNGCINFEFLCELVQIKKYTKPDLEKNIPAKEVPAKKRKQLLINALKRINDETELKFEIYWRKKKPTDRWNYLPQFDFKIRNDEVIPHSDNPVIIEEKREIFRQNLGYELLEVYRFLGRGNDTDFFKWLNDSNKNAKEKDMAYRNANFKTYGKLYKYIDVAIETWLKKLPTITSMNNIDGR